MAGDWHETVAALIADDPGLAWELLTLGEEKARPVCTDPWHRASPDQVGSPRGPESGWTRAESIGAPIHHERRVDRVVEFAFAEGDNLIVLSEVQSGWTDEKMFRLPGYVAKAFQDHEKQVELVIVCKSDALAERYRQGIWMGTRSVVTPIAVGPDDFPPIGHQLMRDRSVQFHLAALLVRGIREDDQSVEKTVAVIAEGLTTINTERAADYVYYLTRLVGDEFTRIMEADMETESRTWHNSYFTRVREDGVKEGVEKGLEEGRLIGERQIVVSLLEAYGVDTSLEQLSRIATCKDSDQLKLWAARASRVRTCDELFAED